MMKSNENQEFKITRVSPDYWRVTIDHPPFNIFGPQSIPMLNSVVTEIESDLAGCGNTDADESADEATETLL